MDPDAHLGESRWKGRRVGTILFAALDRVVGDEPGVAAAPHAARGGLPPRHIGLILILHAHRVAIERRVPARREMEYELMAVVEEPAAVDGLVMPDREVVGKPGTSPRKPLLDRDRLDPVNGVLQAEMTAGRLRHVERRPRVGGFGPHVQKERAVGRQGAGRRTEPPICPLEILGPGDRVVVGAVADAQVVGRRRDDRVDTAGFEAREQRRAVAEIEPEGGRAGRDRGVRTKGTRHRPDCTAVRQRRARRLRRAGFEQGDRGHALALGDHRVVTPVRV